MKWLEPGKWKPLALDIFAWAHGLENKCHAQFEPRNLAAAKSN
jgi:hypothetical protein